MRTTRIPLRPAAQAVAAVGGPALAVTVHPAMGVVRGAARFFALGAT